MTIALAFFGPSAVSAQTGGAWLEAGAGEARWATGASEAGSLRYGMLGLRGVWDPPGIAGFRAQLGAGRGRDGIGTAGWLTGDAGAWITRRVGRFRLRLDADLWAVRYDQDLRYRAAGGRLLPSMEWRAGSWTLRGSAEGQRGWWRLSTEDREGPPAGVPVPLPPSEPEVERGDLSLGGGRLDLIHARGPAWFRVTPASYRAGGRVPDDWQHGVEVETGLATGSLSAAVGARWLSLVPAGSATRTASWSGQARIRVALLDDLALSARYDSRPWDPVHAIPRGAAGTVALEWRWFPPRRSSLPVVELGPWNGTGRMVRFRVKHEGAARVELLGDFSEWRPIAMTRRDDIWEVAVTVRPGTHQFGFLIDYRVWMVPDHAPGIVEDGWDRRNATLVIPVQAP